MEEEREDTPAGATSQESRPSQESRSSISESTVASAEPTLKRHQRVCEYCKLVCNASAYYKHVERVHPDDYIKNAPFTCRYCDDAVFYVELPLKKHEAACRSSHRAPEIASHPKLMVPVDCPYCQLPHPDAYLLAKHLKKEHPSIMAELATNKKSKDLRTFACSTCRFTYLKPFKLAMHWIKMEKDGKPCNGILTIMVDRTLEMASSIREKFACDRPKRAVATLEKANGEEKSTVANEADTKTFFLPLHHEFHRGLSALKLVGAANEHGEFVITASIRSEEEYEAIVKEEIENDEYEEERKQNERMEIDDENGEADEGVKDEEEEEEEDDGMMMDEDGNMVEREEKKREKEHTTMKTSTSSTVMNNTERKKKNANDYWKTRFMCKICRKRCFKTYFSLKDHYMRCMQVNMPRLHKKMLQNIDAIKEKAKSRKPIVDIAKPSTSSSSPLKQPTSSPTMTEDDRTAKKALAHFWRMANCPICDVPCFNLLDVSEHMQDHGTTALNFFICKVCTETFKSVHDLKEHLLTQLKLPGNPCVDSGAVLTMKEAQALENLENKMRRSDQVNPRMLRNMRRDELEKCARLYGSREEKKDETNEEEKKDEEEEGAGMKGKTMNLERIDLSLISGYEQQEEEARRRNELKEKVEKNALHRKHLSEIEEVVKEIYKKWLCPSCPDSIVQYRDMFSLHRHAEERHNKLHRPQFKCKGCQQRFSEPKSLRMHIIERFNLGSALCVNSACVVPSMYTEMQKKAQMTVRPGTSLTTATSPRQHPIRSPIRVGVAMPPQRVYAQRAQQLHLPIQNGWQPPPPPIRIVRPPTQLLSQKVRLAAPSGRPSTSFAPSPQMPSAYYSVVKPRFAGRPHGTAINNLRPKVLIRRSAEEGEIVTREGNGMYSTSSSGGGPRHDGPPYPEMEYADDDEDDELFDGDSTPRASSSLTPRAGTYPAPRVIKVTAARPAVAAGGGGGEGTMNSPSMYYSAALRRPIVRVRASTLTLGATRRL